MKIKKTVIAIFLSLIFLLPTLAAADIGSSNMQKGTFFDKLQQVATGVGYSKETGSSTGQYAVIYGIGRFLIMVFGILGTIFLILIIYAGFRWMTAGGNEEQVAESRKLIINASIGLAIIIFSYAITYLVSSLLANATQGG